MIKKFLGIVALVLVMTAALVVYSATTTVEVPDVPEAATSYRKQLFAKVIEIAKPILQEAGVNVDPENVNVNVVEQQVENAADKVNEATQALAK